MYQIKAWILCPPEEKTRTTKHCKAKTEFTLALKVFWLRIFYDYIEVTRCEMRGKHKRKKRKNCCCETCMNLIPIGEGDHICYECGPEPIMPISDYEPTEEYYKCRGKNWEG